MTPPASRAVRPRFSAHELPDTRSIALTGTPGSGKTAVARKLRRPWRPTEVGALARWAGVGRRRGRATEVDLPALRRWMAHHPSPPGTVLVGHLAHLLPVSGVIVLRCHPVILERRLRRARRGSKWDRRANYVAEAIDLVAREASERGLPIWQVDTSRSTVAEVARSVERLLRTRPQPTHRAVDWLSDPDVTAHLLDRPR